MRNGVGHSVTTSYGSFVLTLVGVGVIMCQSQ